MSAPLGPAAGNRNAQTRQGASYTYTSAATSNRLASISGSGSRSFGYDALGNLSSDARSASSTVTFSYEAFNRLRWVWNNGTLIGSSAPRARSGRSLFVSPGRTHDRACPPSRAPPHVPPLR